MRVLFVTSEVATLFKLGGLADVSYALPTALKRIGVDVTIALPYYASIKFKYSRCVGPVAVSFDGKRELVFIFKAILTGTKVPIYLFRHPLLNEYKTNDDLLKIRFAFFSQAVATYLTVSAMGGVHWSIIHCNDWHTALLPLLLGESPKVFFRVNGDIPGLETLQAQQVHTILTIHNPLYHGTVTAKLVDYIALDRRQFHILNGNGKFTYINMLREGIEYADVMTTVSPTFAKEMIHGNYGPHVTGMLNKRKDKLIGILNGLDTELWNPRWDKAIPYNYSLTDVTSKKPLLKDHLQRSLKMSSLSVPLFSFVGRLDMRQKGIDILLLAAEKLLPSGKMQLVILGTGSKKVVSTVARLAKTFPDRCSFIPTFDENLARRMYAGSDFMLVPSRYEPCGLIQMIAMRYGTIPLVRKTGGLADSVIDGKTGIVFVPYTMTALIQSMQKAINIYHKSPTWNQMVRRVMRQDFSWKRSAKAYKKLYQNLLK